jgi:hypothetical protein
VSEVGKYAANTTVSAEKSRAEIERILSRYGASAFGYLTDGERAVVQFRAHDRYVRFVVALPALAEFRLDRRGWARSSSAQLAAHDQEVRRRWRALALALKAKLEIVASGIATFEEEFAVHTILPDGSSVGDWLLPQVEQAYLSGEMPRSLPLALPSSGPT